MKYWHSTYDIVYEDHAVKLLKFKEGYSEPILIVPPQAGHHSFIADYEEGQSLVQSAIKNSNSSVFAIEWKTCTFKRRNETIVDLFNQLHVCVEQIGKPVNLVGLCQGGWLCTMYATQYVDDIASLTIAGAPIDTWAGDSLLHEVTKLPNSYFANVVAMGGGLMRGSMMLMGWKANDIMQHYFTRYTKSDYKTKRFYEWYDLTQDIAGNWYRWITAFHFKDNAMYKNEIMVGDLYIDMTNLNKLKKPINTVVGIKDEITPKEQCSAIDKYAPINYYEIDAGHIGVFMSGKGIKKVWNTIFSNM